jgi:sulfopyruvate decarboxylase TPP-binding subunit
LILILILILISSCPFMLNPAAAVETLEAAGFSHVVWIPDSALGPWEPALVSSPKVKLIRPCREGEAIGVAAGLLLGGARPLVVCQCTGLFEAGDALRNVIHDLKLPLKLLVGVRSYRAFLAGKTTDNCPAFTEPILRAWQVPYTILADPDAATFGAAVRELADATGPRALLLGE